jgi:hypothetical protein
MSFLTKLAAALTALDYPRMPEKAYWNKKQSGEKYVGPISPVSAHLWLLLRESMDWEDETEKSIIVNIWIVHLRALVSHIEQRNPSEVTEDYLTRYEIRDGWNWYIAEEVTA